MNVYVMRHGETDWNIVKKIQGSTDIPLNHKGIEEAERTSEALNKEGIKFDYVFSSPLKRAYKTALIMAKYSNCTVEQDERLVEFNFGEGEGKTLEELKKDPKYANIVYWFTDSSKYTAEYGSESYKSITSRLDSFIKEKIIPLEGRADNVLICVHGGVIRSLISYIKKAGQSYMTEVKIPNCGVNLLTLKNGIFNVEYIGKTYC